MNFSNGLKMVGIAGLSLLAAACATNTTGPDLAERAPDTSSADTRPLGPVPGSQEDLEAAGNRVYFGLDQYSLTNSARQTLQTQANWLKKYPDSKVLVAGNCDERGTREYNLALGARRAAAARSYLVSLGVDGNRISTVSYGKERPLDPRSTESAWSKNRNATSTLVVPNS
ncbi:MAG: peptidoglycan-associated lipoprotein Pal [Pseudomonadota bacterium]